MRHILRHYVCVCADRYNDTQNYTSFRSIWILEIQSYLKGYFRDVLSNTPYFVY